MLHYETIAPATRELLSKLMSDDHLQDFVLVGDTSLALQLGHRLSVDLDLFSETDFNEEELRAYLTRKYHFQADFMERSTVKGEIGGVMAYLSSVFSLEQMLGFYEQKYHSNTLMPLKGLIFFEDINRDEPVHMADGKPLQWKRIEKRLLSMDRYPERVFEAL